MSSWLNFNESLSSIKGQITNFASNVLADEEGAETTINSNEDFKKICVQKDLEIDRLRKINKELKKSLEKSGQSNGEPNDNNWDWTTPELTVEDNQSKDEISNLREAVKVLENEKNDLLNQLEQLDSDNQQNLTELMGIKEKLQDENSELKDQNEQLNQQNKALISKEEKLKKKLAQFQHEPVENSQENYDLKLKLDETTKELNVLKSTHDTLMKTIEDTEKSAQKEVADLKDKLKKSESENRIIYNELQRAKDIVESAELKGQEDAENCQKLAFILESYEKQVSLLKEELASVKKKVRNSQSDDVSQEMQGQISEALEKISSLQSENVNLKTGLETLRSQSHQECAQLRLQLEDKVREITCLKNTERSLQEQMARLQEDKENMHNVYINIVTDNLKRYFDSPSALLSNEHEASDNPHITEFSRQIENIFKILLEFKQKCESLEKELIEASNEKTQILNEKYNEIEKLIQNSEVLSQEVIKKGEAMKELEAEITNLITSNDVLLSELDSYKNAGLQTISESNEDNMVLLETDLENANKRIKELEEIIDSPSKSATPNDSLEIKINNKQEDYQTLLNSFDDLKIDYNEINFKLNKASERFDIVETENEDLKIQIERIKADFENTDYQLTEANFTVDSLKEELDALKLNIDALQRENKELKLLNMNNIDVKTELNEIKEKWLTEESQRRELEILVKNLTEKQQNSKMTETSLKLQYDTLNKEHFALAEVKNDLEQSLAKAKTVIVEYESNYAELLQKYDSVLLRCEKLSIKLQEKENEVLRIEGLEEDNRSLIVELERQQRSDEELKERLREKEIDIENLSGNLKHVQSQKEELEELTMEQKRNIESLINKEAAMQESLGQLELQVHVKDQELVELQRKLENVQEVQSQKEELTECSVPPNNSPVLQEELQNLQTALKQSQENVALLQHQLQDLANSRNELVNMVTIKHQESLNYHNEIQRLSEILKSETQKYTQLEAKLVQAGEAHDEIAKKNAEIDRLTDQNSFFKENCDGLTKQLLEEQSKLQQILAEKSGPSEKEISLSKQLETLQSYLMELEERSTQELVQAEQKNAELQAKVNDLEQREKNSSTMYTSVSIRANQQVETLQSQLQMVTNQREDLRKKISDAEDLNNKQAAALANLQFVLEQFQKDKEKDVIKETERIRRQINAEKQIQDDLRKEINNLKGQLEESKIGLQAASRLSDQLELLKKQNSGLKDEVSQLQQKLSKSLQTIHDMSSQTDGKIDKSLIKSLIVGFLSSGNTSNWNKDQIQVLKLIATVLDFNQQDHDKVKLNKPQHGSWLGSILFPQPTNQNMTQESLSQAFVRFLENESKPRVVPSLLGEQSTKPSTSTESSKRNTPRTTPSPIVLNEVVLPTFADFGQSRNSSSILKDVLKDNNNS